MNAFVTPDAAGFLASIEYVTMGGDRRPGQRAGRVVGAALLVLLPQVLTFLHEYEQAVLGLLIMLFMIFLRSASCPGWRRCCGSERRERRAAGRADIGIAFGGLRALDGVGSARAPARCWRHRPERRGQETPVQHRLRLYRASTAASRSLAGLYGAPPHRLAPPRLSRTSRTPGVLPQ